MKQTGSIARHSFASILSGIVATLILKTIALGQVTPSWVPTGSLNIPRANHTATLLANGKVLVVGGNGGVNSAELYDPVSGSWSVTGGLGMPRLGPDGKVLVVGVVLLSTVAIAKIPVPLVPGSRS